MGKVVETILKMLQSGAEGTVTIMDTLLVGHWASPRPYFRMKYEPIRFKKDWAEAYRRQQSYYSLLNKLKREGLIKKTESGGKTLWSITRKGREHLGKIWLRESRSKKEESREPFLPNKKYRLKVSKELVIVAFDVPEYARKRRHWLRRCLISFGFKKLQKSIWAGQCGLPRDFIDDLKKLDMLPWVHILAVTKRGTTARILSSER